MIKIGCVYWAATSISKNGQKENRLVLVVEKIAYDYKVIHLTNSLCPFHPQWCISINELNLKTSTGKSITGYFMIHKENTILLNCFVDEKIIIDLEKYFPKFLIKIKDSIVEYNHKRISKLKM